MEKHLPDKPSKLETFVEMVLDKSIRDYRKWKIEKEIDHALENRNKEEFLRLTEELKKIS